MEKDIMISETLVQNPIEQVSSARNPIIRAQMLIRKPVKEVFEAFVNPQITTRFWFTKSSGRLIEGMNIRWEWEMYGVWDDIYVKQIEENRKITIESSDKTIIEWEFISCSEHETFVSISNSGFTGSDDEIINHAIDSMGGYMMVLCGLKALLEHNIELNLVSDRSFPNV